MMPDSPKIGEKKQHSQCLASHQAVVAAWVRYDDADEDEEADGREQGGNVHRWSPRPLNE